MYRCAQIFAGVPQNERDAVAAIEEISGKLFLISHVSFYGITIRKLVKDSTTI